MDNSETEFALKCADAAISGMLEMVDLLQTGQININGPMLKRAQIDARAALHILRELALDTKKQAAQAGKAYFEHRYPQTSAQPATEPH